MKFLLVLLLSISAWGKEIYIPHEKLPQELHYLLESLQNFELTVEEQKTLDIAITNLNNDFKHISYVDLDFIIRSEIYKQLLNNRSNSIDPQSNSKLEKARADIQDPFIKWVIQSIQSDLRQTDSKKLSLVIPLANYVTTYSTEELAITFKNQELEIIKKIQKKAHILTTHSNNSVNDQMFFSKTQANVVKESTMKILDKITTAPESGPKKLPKPVNDWLEDIIKIDSQRPKNHNKTEQKDPDQDWVLE